jgi:nicotinate dehydrogenase subunit A
MTEPSVELVVNGTSLTVAAHPDTPLLTVLRDQLDLVGARYGCGQGLCGACVVLADGAPLPACQTPLWQVEGQRVTTIEGLGSDGAAHPVQQAMLERQAGQCGFCLSGIVMRAAALLADEPDAEEAEVRAALDPHLCRCGTHGRIVEAVLAARSRE